MKVTDPFKILKRFGELPDDAVLGPKPTAIILGISERTLRRSPPIPKRQITARNGGYRAGDIRQLVRSNRPAA